MKFDLAQVPFSRFGSYLAIERRDRDIYLRTLHGDATCAEVCRIELTQSGEVVSPLINATPSALHLEYGHAPLSIVFSDNDTLRMRAQGIGFRLCFDYALYDSAMPWQNAWLINRFVNRMRYALFVVAGSISFKNLNGEQTCLVFECEPDASGACELIVAEALEKVPALDALIKQSFSDCVTDTEREFSQWLQLAPTVSNEFSEARELAAYVQWSSVVVPHGNFQRHTMLMSKHWFNAVWSWDHCFNAMALLNSNAALAWDQLALLFDCQNAAGTLPDCVSDKTVVWNFCKPPIHGWTLQWMLMRGEIDHEKLLEIYEPLSHWTQWWLDARTGSDGLPQYFHGNDSGWDNATVFDNGVPVESPDLAAFLVVQMDVLADIAQRLNQSQAAVDWKKRADELLKKMLVHHWHDNRFVALHDRKPCAGDSLLLLLPIVLGQRLPLSIRRDLIASLKQENRFLTVFGLASESVASDAYQANGYWRGPIWAPAVFLVVESLRALGEKGFADEIAYRFCKTVARSGMAENFDALTGDGLCDRAHTWTASVFLLLAHSLI